MNISVRKITLKEKLAWYGADCTSNKDFEYGLFIGSRCLMTGSQSFCNNTKKSLFSGENNG